MFASLLRGWKCLVQFARFLNIPLTDSGRSAAFGTGAAAIAFAVSIPIIPLHPLLGHLLLAGQMLGVLVLAARYGRAGSYAGFTVTTFGYGSALIAFVLTTGGGADQLSELPILLGFGVIITIACGWFGEGKLRQHRLVKQLAHAEGRLGALIDAMPSGLLVLERNGRIQFSNTMARRLLATDAPEEFGLSLADLVAEEAWPVLRARLYEPVSAELVRVTIPGERPLRTEWRLTRFLDDGRPRVLAFLWDAEEKHRHEEESSSLVAALRCLREGVILTDLENNIRYANPAAAHMHGFEERHELLGRPLRELVAPSRLEGFNERLERARAVEAEYETRIARPDGGETEIHLTTSPVRRDGALIGVVGVFRDLTESKVLARRALAADKQATLGRLVAGAAHEINNPLTAILGGAELLQESVRHDAEASDLLRMMVGECSRAGRIVRDLLSFARQRPVARTPVDLADVVRSAVALREGYARAAGIELSFDAASAAPVQVDVDQIKQVVLNLLVNAEDAVAKAATKRISVTIGRRGGRALLLVNDSGPGVPEELVHQIFEPFFTTKPEGHGTGLGLAVSHGIVAEHGGCMNVSRGVLGGAQFEVEFPVPATMEPWTDCPAPAPQRAGLRILLVDDERPILEAVGRILQRLGHDVWTSTKGEEAIALTRIERFDVIMSDLRMPGMSGRELHARLTEAGVLERTDFVVATGDIADPEAFAFLQATGLPVLLKPFEIKDLVEMLGRCRAGAAHCPCNETSTC